MYPEHHPLHHHGAGPRRQRPGHSPGTVPGQPKPDHWQPPRLHTARKSGRSFDWRHDGLHRSDHRRQRPCGHFAKPDPYHGDWDGAQQKRHLPDGCQYHYVCLPRRCQPREHQHLCVYGYGDRRCPAGLYGLPTQHYRQCGSGHLCAHPYGRLFAHLGCESLGDGHGSLFANGHLQHFTGQHLCCGGFLPLCNLVCHGQFQQYQLKLCPVHLCGRFRSPGSHLRRTVPSFTTLPNNNCVENNNSTYPTLINPAFTPALPTFTDNCAPGSVVISRVPGQPGQYCVGTHPLFWRITDGNGNSATCAQTITVLSNVACARALPRFPYQRA